LAHRISQVLVVEDNEADVFLIQEALSKTGLSLSVHFARDGEQAVSFLTETDANQDAPCPDLLVLDINLPKLDGGEVLKHLRQLPRCAGTRVLVVSTSDSSRDRQRMTGLGANGYFRKPSQYDQFMKLSDVVKTFLTEIPDRE
jgi:two-component system, chemotaxis family, response regulator Rcp1